MPQNQSNQKDDPLTPKEKQQLLTLMQKINSNPKTKALLLKSLEAANKK